MFRIGKVGAAFVFALLLPVVASAQATISGVVKDASGAVLPGVTVEASSPALIEKVRTAVTDGTGQYAIENLRPGVYSVRFTLVGFSAGHGAVRAILRTPRHFDRVSAVLLLDGMHTAYVPDGKPIAAGGSLDTTNLVAFADFARAAIAGKKPFLVTHSEIFPGTFASTTETADWLLATLGLHRTPVMQRGPRGMQQLSEVRAGQFELLGFAGNSAPDHVDQLHPLPVFLGMLR